MADNIGMLGQNFNEGFKTGFATGGKKKAALATALAEVVKNMQAQQKAQGDTDQANQLLGVKGLITGETQVAKPGEQGSFGISGLNDQSGKSIALKSGGGTSYTVTTDLDTGEPVVKPIFGIGRKDRVIKISNKSGMSSKDIEQAAQLLASGKEAPGQLSGFSKQKQNVINRAGEINPNFNAKQADLAFSAQKSEMGNAKTQDMKLNQANNLMTIFNNAYDPKTDTYTIPPSQHTEIAMGYAKMLSPTGVVAQDLVEKLTQGTLQEKLNAARIYFGQDPIKTGGSTQSVLKFFRDAIDNQAKQTLAQRQQYQEGGVSDYIGIQKGFKPIKTAQSDNGTQDVDYKSKYGLQ